MHLSETPKPTALDSSTTPWYRTLTRAHWFVLVVASLGWLFDTMDQQLFNLARRPAIAELLGAGATPAAIAEYSGYATMIVCASGPVMNLAYSHAAFCFAASLVVMMIAHPPVGMPPLALS